MSDSFSGNDSFKENSLFLNRIVVSVTLMSLLTVVLVGRLVYLQISSHELYTTLSRDNQVRLAPISPLRGMILDRNGEPLAENVPSYTLEVIPEKTENFEQTLETLTPLINLQEEELAAIRNQRQVRKSFESLPIRLWLSEDEIARIALKLPWLPGVSISTRSVRTYPYADLAAHVVGYVARISESEQKKLDTAEYQGTAFIGKNGLEKSYESVLHGRTGFEQYETNVKGYILRELGIKDAIPGADLYLSLDIALQRVARDALGTFSGAVVAIEPSTGRVLAMVSNPGFDPNPFINGISKDRYQALQQDEEKPLYDRTIRGLFPPGSTVKPFVALAGLEILNLSPSSRVSCPGYYRLPDSAHKYRDWRPSGHGPTDLKSAITQSCDVYFYDLAHRIGIQKLHDYMHERFGFGAATGIDLPGEKPGLFPSESWKLKFRKAPWQAGETVITGIGQGYVLTTPLQMARATAMLANRGAVVQPRLVERIKSRLEIETPYPREENSSTALIPEGDWETVVSAMIDVVHSAAGTAKAAGRGLTYHIAGKTGTAQVFTVAQDKSYKSMKITKNMRDHAWFMGFAPAESPRIAVVVIAEHGGHGGSVAAPVARAVMDRYLLGSGP